MYTPRHPKVPPAEKTKNLQPSPFPFLSLFSPFAPVKFPSPPRLEKLSLQKIAGNLLGKSPTHGKSTPSNWEIAGNFPGNQWESLGIPGISHPNPTPPLPLCAFADLRAFAFRPLISRPFQSPPRKRPAISTVTHCYTSLRQKIFPKTKSRIVNSNSKNFAAKEG